ncbi:VanZ family protein [Pseudogracilibacillus auburnensis]|uniref:VanZ family protein n=1 Tax=Pseudogracilibacillus auburnensis TaxID=1494959 RepID=A0A2V3WB61_9BACI|nr:VanZ family protein [Pseudogracilibacillus auburnensis]PXW90251.1 VanZ family protein [Pseudogracilibacillus auburnensis]
MSIGRENNKIIAWSAVIIWMAMIFFLSHQPATSSGQLSASITNFLIQTITAIFPFEIESTSFHFFIRKGAHFFAYFVLGVLVIHALKNKYIYLAIVICVMYAISDEVHQLFITGRSGEVRDVLIDSIGATIGITVYYLMCKLLRRKWARS